MSLNEVAKNSCFKGLTCPYTGKSATVRVIAYGGDMPRYFSPDAFDPSAVQPSSIKLLELAGTRNGIMGAKTGGNELICPYTGNRMTIEALPDKGGYWLSGGFNPSHPLSDPQAFAYAMATRDGKPPEDMQPTRDNVSFPTDRPPSVSVKDPVPKDYALAHCDRVIHDALPSKISVTVPKSVHHRRKV